MNYLYLLAVPAVFLVIGLVVDLIEHKPLRKGYK